MNKLFIEATRSTPRVEFLPTGEMSISGRSLPEDPFGFYDTLFGWVKQSTLESVSIEIHLEYMNTSSSKQIYSLLINLREKVSVRNILVKWYFEEGDEDNLETGKEFESMLNIPFVYHEFADTLA